ncbi:MAG: helix-hairpin-helix domain-containing protein [Desulfuromonadaceae bacterium]|nr:helix-hairpin-helix domain-containing protein [Desulfuromonadaceae bacterium]
MKKLSILAVAFIMTASISFAADTIKTIPAKPVMPAMPAMPSAPAAKMELIDINSATEAELKAIPGVGDTYAKKIMAGRPFSNKSQLLSKKIVPKPVYDKVKGMIIAKKIKK